MSLVSRFSKIAFGSVVGLAALVGAAVLVQPASGARPGRPGPLCGPTILFICSAPGQDDVLVGLTICEVAAFEKKTGLTCEPFGG